MSTETKPPTPPTPYAFDETKFKTKGEELRKEQQQYIGKHNHNPFLWINQNVIPLEMRFIKGERTKELHDAMLNLKSEAPKIDARLLDADVPKDASPQPKNVQQVASGLKLPQPKL